MTRQLKIEQPFNLELSLTMGQAFRWHKLPADFYGDGHKWVSGVLGENLLHIRQTDDGVEYRVGGPDGERAGTPADDEMLRRYFREDDDVAAIYQDICRDPVVAGLVRKYPGMRVLRQEPWECLVSYIFSQTATIHSIKNNVEKMARISLQKAILVNEERNVFPTVEQVVVAGLPALKDLRFGLKKDQNTFEAARRIRAGTLQLTDLGQSDTPCRVAVGKLDDLPGVGLKIANCAALMSLDKLDAFPVDRWILRALEHTNYDNCPLPETNRKTLYDSDHRKLHDWAEGHFGKYAGWAGQYLFHGIEPNK